jgi:predicted site-specific integrase-resolvase
MLNIVAIDQEKASWIHVIGENRAKNGWIERVAVRKDKEDVVTAILIRKALRGKENTMTGAEMEKIVATLPNPNNYFAVKILQKYKSAEEAKQEEVTQEEVIQDEVNDDTIDSATDDAGEEEFED